MSIISITTIFRSNCYLYINREQKFLIFENNQLVLSDNCFKLEIFSTNIVNTLGLILLGKTPYIIYIDENNNNYDLNYLRYSKIPFEQKLIYSLDGLALHYIENKIIFKERNLDNDKYLVSIHLDNNYEPLIIIDSVIFSLNKFNIKFSLKHNLIDKNNIILGKAETDKQNNKIIKIVEILSNIKMDILFDINTYYFIMFDFFDVLNTKRRLLFNEKFLVLKYNNIQHFYFDNYFDIDTNNTVEIEEIN